MSEGVAICRAPGLCSRASVFLLRSTHPRINKRDSVPETASHFLQMIVVSPLDDITSLLTPRLMWEILYKYPASTSHCVTRPLKDGQLAAERQAQPAWDRRP